MKASFISLRSSWRCVLSLTRGLRCHNAPKYLHESGFWHLVLLEQFPAVSSGTLGKQGSSCASSVPSAIVGASASHSACARQEKGGYIFEYTPLPQMREEHFMKVPMQVNRIGVKPSQDPRELSLVNKDCWCLCSALHHPQCLWATENCSC